MFLGVSITIFHKGCKSSLNWNYLCSTYDYDDPTRSQIYTCHKRWALVTCTKLWPDQIIIFQVWTNRISQDLDYELINLSSMTMKWVPGNTGSQQYTLQDSIAIASQTGPDYICKSIDFPHRISPANLPPDHSPQAKITSWYGQTQPVILWSHT